MRCDAKLLILGSLAVAVTAGCTPVDPGFGEAQRYDMAIQTVNPDPVYPEGSLEPGYHGEKGQKALGCSGTDGESWMLIDFVDVVVHIFDAKSREFYDLERLWRDAGRVSLPDDL